jgi:hypothetical protein
MLVVVSVPALLQAPVLNPRLCSPALIRYIETLTVPYAELARAYRKCASAAGAGASAQAEFSQLVDSSGDVFLLDKNLGLVKQLQRSLGKKQITRLTQTYLTCSLEDVAANMAHQQAAQPATAKQAAVQKAEAYVFDMVRSSRAGMREGRDTPTTDAVVFPFRLPCHSLLSSLSHILCVL